MSIDGVVLFLRPRAAAVSTSLVSRFIGRGNNSCTRQRQSLNNFHPARSPAGLQDQQHVDPASSVMSVFDDMGDVVDEIGEQLAHDMAQESDAAGDSSTPEEGMQSLTYAAKRDMSQVKVEITDVEVRGLCYMRS